MGTTSELLHLDEWSFVEWKLMDLPISFFFNQAFNMAMVQNFQVMLE
jgi:hypothetical protein